MNKTISTVSIALMSLMSGLAFADGPGGGGIGGPGGSVPEMDAGMGVIALGLTVGIVALVKEYRGRK